MEYGNMIFVTAIVIISLFIVAVYMLVRNVRYEALADKRTKTVPWLLFLTCLTLFLDLMSSGESSMGLIADLMPALLCLFLCNSSFWNQDSIATVIVSAVVAESLLAVCHALCVLEIIRVFPVMYDLGLVLFSVFVLAGVFVWSVFEKLRNVKTIMKTGTIWANVTLAVDAVYMVSILFIILVYGYAEMLAGQDMQIHSILAVLFLGGCLTAMGVRLFSGSAFVLMQKHERRIVESLKVTKVESAVDASGIEDVYKDIYERVVAYFENEKPFLDSELTINDLVKVLYSNKLYISRAISQFTGRNFCQFVNYYRIAYALECFRSNPELKNHELSTMSGFNSIVSYNMAFRLFMGENPSEWCRKEKNRIIKGKK